MRPGTRRARGKAELSAACRQHLEAIAVPRHASWDPVGLMAVRSYVHQQLAALGDVEEHSFRSGSHEGVNLMLKLPGRNPRRRPLLVGAHYDGPLQSIGADDNASAAQHGEASAAQDIEQSVAVGSYVSVFYGMR